MNQIPELIDDIRNGKMVILVDDEDRENEGDLILSADHVTPAAINFMVSQARGLVCLALTQQQIKKLKIPLMVQDEFNVSPNKTAFTVSIEAAHGVTTGISAADRAHTVRVACHPEAKPSDIAMPGHIFPIQAQPGGVLRRAGHTEASVDLASLAGLNPAAVICEIMNEDGTMARVDELKKFAHRHNLKIGSIEDLIRYRIQTESFVTEEARSHLPTYFGEDFEVRVFKNQLDGREHLVLIKGTIDPEQPVLVRVHTENIIGDVFGSQRTRSGEYLRAAMRQINEYGQGVIVYLRLESMEGRLINRVKAYQQIDAGIQTEERLLHGLGSDERDYGIGAQILRALNIHQIRLLSNNPSKRVGLKGYGLEIVDSLKLEVPEDFMRSYRSMWFGRSRKDHTQ